MTEHHFFSKSFFDNLANNQPISETSDAKELISSANFADLENKKFLNKNSNYLITLGFIMFLIGIMFFLLNDLAIIFMILGFAFSIPFFLQVISHQPDKFIKKKLQKFQKSLSQGLRKPAIKKLTRSKSDRMIFGVLSGLSKRLGIPVWFLRLIALSLLFVSGGFVLIFYIVLASSIPEEDSIPELED